MSQPIQLFNVPNVLTLSRLASLPITVVLFRYGHGVASASLFALAMLSDCVDGALARRLGQQTSLGLYLDPVVDKIVILGLFYELARAGVMPAAIPHLLLARELLQNAVRAGAAAHGSVVGANWMGKTKAALQSVLVACGLLLPSLTPRLAHDTVLQLGRGLAAAAWVLVAAAWLFFYLFARRNRAAFLAPSN